MSKLLHRPFKAFTIYALVILACSVPVYYLVVDFIWLSELDEHNQIVKERIQESFSKISIEQGELNSLVENWEKLQPGTRLSPAATSIAAPDSSYTITRKNVYSKRDEIDRFRGLSCYININGKPYHLQIETNVEETHETILAITIVALLFFILLVAGFIVLNKRIARKTWLPFHTTLDKLKEFDLTQQRAISFDKTEVDEFQELNRSLGSLIDKNVSVYSQQKTFIENASHELQTPLAVLRSKLDLLLQDKNITNDQFEILSAIELPVARITRINKNLLLLAKIENNQFADKEEVSLAEIVGETLELLSDYITTKQMAVDKKLEGELTLLCNKTLLETLISNLLINAVVHSSGKGPLSVRLSGKTLTVSNTGQVALDRERIFERFIVSSTETANSGLGLAIVREICSRYGWHVSYAFDRGFHSFSVTF